MSNRKVALVTGSGKRRIGNVIAETLAERGLDVVLHYHRSAAEAQQSCDQIKAKGSQAIAFRADFSRENEVDQLIERALGHWGRIDVLVNSAAMWESKPLEQVTAADVRRHLEINTLATFLCAQKIGLAMVQQPEGGVIINFGDWAIVRPYRNYAAYFPSKGAIPALTRSLAVELGTRNPAVRVNCILPGPVMLSPDLPELERQKIAEQTLVKRIGRPEHIAQAVWFLVENDFVTGASLVVDGGRSVWAGEA